MKKTCVTFIPTHPKHPMRGLRIALANHHEVKRDEQHRILNATFIPWQFDGMMEALAYAKTLLSILPQSEPNVVTYDEAMKYGQQEADLLAGKIQVTYLPN